MYPGHGSISKNPEQDMEKALVNAKMLLNEEKEVEIAHEEIPPS
jgi:hypothetical protein